MANWDEGRQVGVRPSARCDEAKLSTDDERTQHESMIVGYIWIVARCEKKWS